MQPYNKELMQEFQNCLKHIKDIPRIVSRLKSYNASIGDWKGLYEVDLEDS